MSKSLQKIACFFALSVLVVVAIALLAGSLTAEDGKSKANTEGWIELFNGKDLQGWKTTGNWFPKDGVLAIVPRPGEQGWQRYSAYLWHEKQFGDFELDLEFKLPQGGNSGVFFRVGDVKNPVDTGLEVQILDSLGKPDDQLTHHDNGGVIRTAAPSKNASKPAGEWSRMVITAKGQHLQVKLNGEKVIDIQLDQAESEGNPLTGPIGLQDHGLPLWFRNIRIRELK